jgi:hypothetical protein
LAYVKFLNYIGLDPNFSIAAEGWDAFITKDPILAFLKEISDEIVTDVKLNCYTRNQEESKKENEVFDIINEKFKFKLTFRKLNIKNWDSKSDINNRPYKNIFYTIIPKDQNITSRVISDGIGESLLMNSDWDRSSCSNEENIINLYTLKKEVPGKKRSTLRRPDLILGCNRTLIEIRKEYSNYTNEKHQSLTVQCPQGCLSKAKESKVFGAGIYSDNSSICL